MMSPRSAFRALRGTRVLGRAAATVDRAWWAVVILRADIVDREYVSAAAGRSVGRVGAVLAYVRGGWSRGMGLNPLLSESTVATLLSPDGRVPGIYAYLVNEKANVQVSPNWDSVAYASRVPESIGAPGGPLRHAWRAARGSGTFRLGVGAERRDVGWDAILETARTAARCPSVDRVFAEEGAGHAAAPDVGLVFALGDDEPDSSAVIRQALALRESEAALLRIDVRGGTVDARTQAALAALWAPSVVVRLGPTGMLDAGEPAGAHPLTSVELHRDAGARVSTAGLQVLLRAGRRQPSGALWVDDDGTVVSAGLVSGTAGSARLLSGLAVEDARRLGAELRVDRLDTPVRAHPTATGPHGPGAITLTSVVAQCPRPVAPRPDELVVPETRDRLLPLGLDVRVAPDGKGFRYQRDPRAVRLADGRSVPSLRWALKTSSPVGEAGLSWGDTHFARSLADALERLGQEVVVDARSAAHRATSYLDDVSLVIRGPHRIDPPPTGRSLVWVISHPDEITRDELMVFDRVFAASESWSAKTERATGVRVTPLLQCTDARRFRPSGAVRGDSLLFVGTARGIVRPSVVEPIRAGIPVEVHGPDWRAFIPESAIASTGVPHADLARMYEAAGVVLNDHWPAMQAEGFIANRPFDVVAAGGRVISDHVDGIEEIFDGTVRTYRSIPELIDLLRTPLDRLFPSDAEATRVRERVRSEHSFDRRAAQLLEAALALG